ncbi:MAG TPA: hypothetical protein VKX16_03820 [Chloroflexota bacterium]|nr:hypothetical protein [Chloroflexota bacterium]
MEVRTRPSPPAATPAATYASSASPPAGDAPAATSAIALSLADAAFPLLLTACALTIWGLSLPSVDLSHMTDIGLISVLPGAVFLAIGLVNLSFALTLRQQRLQTWLILLHIGILILMLYGVTMFVEQGVPRFAATWKHIGITDYVLNSGNVNPNIDAYFNWPGFFILSAFVTKITGFSSSEGLVLWAPVFYNVLYLGPLYGIFTSATGDRRLVWLGIWLFYLTNWVGQDYFSPQGLDYFLYLVVIAIVVTWFKSTSRWPNPAMGRYLRALGPLRRWGERLLAPPDAPNAHSTALQRLSLIVIAVVLMAITVPSHQLTPFATFTALTGLALFNRSSLRFMPVLLMVLTGTWISYMTENFLSGHLGMVAGHVGQVSATVNQNVTDRIHGSSDHVLVVLTGVVLSLAIWGLAGLGVVRSLRERYWDLTLVLLAVAPFTLILLQAYEGELVLRIYLFALPAVIFFAAALFFTTPRTGRSWMTTVAIVAVCELLAIGFFLSRYGNERMDHFTPAEIAAVKQLYRIAPPHSLLLAGSDNIPWRFANYATETTESLDDPSVVPSAAVMGSTGHLTAVVADLMANPRYRRSFFIITRSEKAYVNLFRVFPEYTLDDLESSLDRSRTFRVVYRNADAIIYTLEAQVKGKAA